MKFLVDAQLPRRIAWFLRSAGHEAAHTLDLPSENKTPDNDITTYDFVELTPKRAYSAGVKAKNILRLWGERPL